MQAKQNDSPTVLQSILAGTVTLVYDPRNVKDAELRLGECPAFRFSAAFIRQLRNDFAKLVAAPGFLEWEKATGANPSRSEALKRAWARRRIMAAKTNKELKSAISRVRGKGKGPGRPPKSPQQAANGRKRVSAKAPKPPKQREKVSLIQSAA